MTPYSPSLRHSMPGAGFVLLVITCLISMGTIVWGMRTPPLERVWRLQLELRLGELHRLEPADWSLLQDTLLRFPMFTDHILNDAGCGIVSANLGGVIDSGVAYAVRRDAAACEHLVVSSPTGEGLQLRVRTATVHAQGEANGSPFGWRLPDADPFPQLIEVRLQDTGTSDLPAAMLLELKGTE